MPNAKPSEPFCSVVDRLGQPCPNEAYVGELCDAHYRRVVRARKATERNAKLGLPPVKPDLEAPFRREGEEGRRVFLSLRVRRSTKKIFSAIAKAQGKESAYAAAAALLEEYAEHWNRTRLGQTG